MTKHTCKEMQEIFIENLRPNPFAENNGYNDPWAKCFRKIGLQDKNGTEIYEGDIVNAFDYQSEKIVNKFVITYGIMENCGDCFDDSGIGYNFYLKEPEECEIIGNIFENPELLEKISNLPTRKN